ncbi:MAG: alpha/beta fold hydrolase, partial [Nannocystaceae bacterium]
AAAQLGFDVSIYCPEQDCPAARVAIDQAIGAYTDIEALLAWAKTNFVEEANGLETPLLVLVGEHDGAITEDVVKQTFLQWYPNAKHDVLVNAGHYPMQETPVQLATRMEAFMREQGAKA